MKSAALETGRRLRSRKRKGGKLVLIKNAASARNGGGRKIVITGHGVSSRALLHGGFHMGSRIGRAYSARVEALTAQHGGADTLTASQHVLIDRAARLGIMVQIACDELMRGGAFAKNGQLRPSFDAVRRVISDECALLKLLGLQRAEKAVPSLEEYLRGRSDDADA